MYRQILNASLSICLLSTTLLADDKVSNWLAQMGCNELLALHLEQELDSGSTQEKIDAAERLATLYAYMLSQSDGTDDNKLLERANSLLDSIPQANTIDLRLQLLRASYLTSELTFEKYRLRMISREEAEEQFLILQDTAKKLESLRASLKRKAKNSKNFTTKDSTRLGIATSLAAWATYYQAWFNNDKELAIEAASIFATMLEGDSASLQDVSLDLRKEEFGARALLGITLCKNLSNIAGEQYTWLEELGHADTWAGVKHQLPMWTIMMHIDNGQWALVKDTLLDRFVILEPHTLRLAAVQGIEAATPESKEVAAIAIGKLIEDSELGIVSQIIEKHGHEPIEANAFVSNYLKGELAYRSAKESLGGDMPSDNPELIEKFINAQELLSAALSAQNANDFPSVKDDCSYLLGLSQFFSNSCSDSARTFYELGKRTTSEKALWMAIVALQHLTPQTPNSIVLLNDAVQLYSTLWPNSQKTTQLKLQFPSQIADSSTIEELLTIPPSDSNYANVRRKASRLLYQQWSNTKPLERTDIGNTYVGVVLPIIIEDSKSSEVEHQQNALVRSLRLLEVALHRDVKRNVAAAQVLDIIKALSKGGVDTTQFENEITYRTILLLFEEESQEAAIAKTLDFLTQHPTDVWANHASVYAWNKVAIDNDVLNETILELGLFLLKDIDDESLSEHQYVNVTKLVSKQLLMQYDSTHDPELLTQAHSYAKVLLQAYPNSHDILKINAQVEHFLGNNEASENHWNTILDASAKGSEQWLEAKYNIAFLLSKSDIDKANTMLNQFAALYPNYGVGTFSTKLRELHRSLGGSPNDP